MLDEIRSMDWIPRSVHERITLLQKTYSELLHRLGRPPSDQEVGKELKMSQEELDEFLTRSRVRLSSVSTTWASKMRTATRSSAC